MLVDVVDDNGEQADQPQVQACLHSVGGQGASWISMARHTEFSEAPARAVDPPTSRSSQVYARGQNLRRSGIAHSVLRDAASAGPPQDPQSPSAPAL